MAEHQNDDEQAEALKKWLEQNGTSLVVGLVVSLAAVFGYQGWQTNLTDEGEAASSVYEDLLATTNISPLEQLTEEQLATSVHLAESLKGDYEGSSYAVFAALHMAKLAVHKNDLGTAEKELSWALDHAASDSIEHITRLRLARVMLSQGKAGDALNLLEDHDAGTYSSSYEEVRGDAYHALGRKRQARETYQKAIDNMIDKTSKPVLEMKLSDLTLNETDAVSDTEIMGTETQQVEQQDQETDQARELQPAPDQGQASEQGQEQTKAVDEEGAGE